MQATSEMWYRDPERFVDASDIDKLGKSAIQLIRDLIVSRLTENDVMSDLWKVAISRPVHLLPSQERTLRLAEEAREKGLTEAVYIADRLKLSRRAAYYRLETLNNRLMIMNYQSGVKTFTYRNNIPLANESRIQLDTHDIKRIYAGLTFNCPAHGANQSCLGTARAKYGVCKECADYYGRHQEDRPIWLQEMVKSLQREAWAEAKQLLFQASHGINMDISELDN